MDLGLSCAKYVLFFFNFLFAMLGIAMVVIGISVSTKIMDYQDFIEYDLTPYPVILCVVGCIVFFIAYLGCCGAIQENTGMLCLYACTMIIIVAFEVGLIYLTYTKNADLKRIVNNRLDYTLHNAKRSPTYLKSWNLLQTELKCCGITGPNDWKYVFPNDILPGSCCQKNSSVKTCQKSEIIQTGCKIALNDYLNNHSVAVVGIAIGIAIAQTLTIILPCCLFSAFRRDQRFPRRWNRF